MALNADSATSPPAPGMISALPPNAPLMISFWLVSLIMVAVAVAIGLRTATRYAKQRDAGSPARPTGLYVAAGIAALAAGTALAGQARTLAMGAVGIAIVCMTFALRDSRR